MYEENQTKRAGVKPVGAAKLTIEILRFLARQRGSIGVTPLAKALDKYPGTVYAILKTLQDEGVVEFNPDVKTYKLCLGGVLELNAYQRMEDLPRRIEDDMDDICNQLGVCIYLSQLVRKDSMIIIASSLPDKPLGIYSKVGTRFPVPFGGIGRILVGQESTEEEHLKIAFTQTRWLREKMDYASWARQVRIDHEAGYAYEEDSMPEGMATVCVPVLETGRPVRYAINAIGMRGDFVGEKRPRIVSAINQLAELAARRH